MQIMVGSMGWLAPRLPRWPEHIRLNRKLQNLVNGLDILVRRAIGHNQDGADEAHGTASLTNDMEPLAEEIGAEHRAHKHAQCPERRN